MDRGEPVNGPTSEHGQRGPGRVAATSHAQVGLRAAMCGMLAVALTGTAVADSHLAPETSDTDLGSYSASQAGEAKAPPPGTMGLEGVTPIAPEDAKTPEEATVAEVSAKSVDDIGPFAGPADSVYGDPPNSVVGNPEDWPWRYDTRYFFGITHGLEDGTDLSQKGRRWVSALTLPLDVVFLPTSALAGLSGRSPETVGTVANTTEGPATSEAAVPSDDGTPGDVPDADPDANAEPTGTQPDGEAPESVPSAEG